MPDFTIASSIDAVLPLVARPGKEADDVERARLLLRSLRIFFNREQKLRLHVVSPGDQLEAIRGALAPFAAPWLALDFHDEAAILPPRVSGRHGWLKQQVVKLAVPEWLGVPAWLTLDADVVCVRPFGIERLFPGGRALLRMNDTTNIPLFADWMRASADLLGIAAGPTRMLMGITPAIYVGAVAVALHRMIEDAHSRPWKEVLLDPAVIARLEHAHRGSTWSENALYHLAALRLGALRSHHATSGIDTRWWLHRDGGIWDERQRAQWSPAAAFAPDNAGLFAVCNSYTGAPADFVASSMEPHLARFERDGEAMAAASVPQPQWRLHDHEDEIRDGEPLIRCRILSLDPLIVVSPYDRYASSVLAREVAEPLAGRQAWFLVALPFDFGAVPAALELAARIARRQREVPAHRHVILCNTHEELDNFKALGLPCALVSHNALICERPFLDAADGPIAYDAVYNAGLVPWKRHELAAGLKSLALLFADWHDDAETPAYVAGLRRLLPRAEFLNRPSPDSAYRLFGADEVAAVLARSRVGLCLSAREGAMRASIEYLFAGLPVVSTPSTGGRDLFFDPAHCLIVEPDPVAVARAVDELVARAPPRAVIRRRTLELVELHRARFMQIVGRIFAEERADPRRLESIVWPWHDAGGVHVSRSVTAFLRHLNLVFAVDG